MYMSKSFFVKVNFLGMLFCPLLFFSCSHQETEKTTQAASVKVQEITHDHTNYVDEYIGVAESENTVDVSFLVTGNIERMFASEGQRVAKGQLLANLNTTSLKNAHGLSLAALKQAEDAYQRLSAMYQNKSIPDMQYIDAKTKLEQAKATEAIAKKNLSDCNLYAPQSGVIGERYVEQGSNIMPASPVYNIMDVSSVKIRVAIPEREISNISIGQDTEVKINALGNRGFHGKIIEKGVAANPISHTYDIKIKLQNPDGKIMPGMVCRAYLSGTDSGNESIIVPLKSVQVDHSGKRFVWLKDQESKASYKEVTLGKLSGNGVVITEGLRVGDELITEGYQNISTGTLVSVYEN